MKEVVNVCSLIAVLLAAWCLVGLPDATAAPRKTIAVSEFDNKSSWRGQWRIGWGMQEMMCTALVDTGKFTVLERQDLDAIMAEQDLGASGRTGKGSAAAIGKLGKAQILISGAVTEFEEKKGGEGAGIGFKGFRIGGSHEQAHVAINVRIYDTSSGEVLDSIRVEGTADAGGLKLGYSNADFGGDLGGFRKTPLGKATQEAIDESVQKIASRLKSVPWQGKIIKATPSKVYINAGSKGGIDDGMEFDVYRPGESLVDPDTGMTLGAETEKIGRIKVSSVKEKFSIAKIVSGADMQRGDLIKSE
ncbi:MAG: CsgG/HfaB family protein [Candidatus Euphemobacter frigidus]|nr:CsgG/HfaB family protein [Candidatus Euphemobacter frigidus]MDP8275600.1 CsgG/HfaB family protein [Candidatus Euphemobacter frigidus]